MYLVILKEIQNQLKSRFCLKKDAQSESRELIIRLKFCKTISFSLNSKLVDFGYSKISHGLV